MDHGLVASQSGSAAHHVTMMDLHQQDNMHAPHVQPTTSIVPLSKMMHTRN